MILFALCQYDKLIFMDIKLTMDQRRTNSKFISIELRQYPNIILRICAKFLLVISLLYIHLQNLLNKRFEEHDRVLNLNFYFLFHRENVV